MTGRVHAWRHDFKIPTREYALLNKLQVQFFKFQDFVKIMHFQLNLVGMPKDHILHVFTAKKSIFQAPWEFVVKFFLTFLGRFYITFDDLEPDEARTKSNFLKFQDFVKITHFQLHLVGMPNVQKYLNFLMIAFLMIKNFYGVKKREKMCFLNI